MSHEPSGWIDLINKSVHTNDDQAIGDIEGLGTKFVLLKGALVNLQRYSIRLLKVEG